jgi:hypothetical protein
MLKKPTKMEQNFPGDLSVFLHFYFSHNKYSAAKTPNQQQASIIKIKKEIEVSHLFAIF